MNPIEKGTKLGRDLFEINTDSLRKIAELSAENFKRYMELNQDYLQKLPEVREFSAFVELQRDYGKSLWEGVQEDMKARGEIVREAVEHSGSALRGVFSADDADAPVEAAA
jgi:hypothetical protein